MAGKSHCGEAGGGIGQDNGTIDDRVRAHTNFINFLFDYHSVMCIILVA